KSGHFLAPLPATSGHVVWLGSRPEETGQLGRLLHPVGHLSLVEFVAFADVYIARITALGVAGRNRTQRHAAEESHLDVLGKAMDAEDPAVSFTPVQRRVPFYCLVHAGDGAYDKRVNAAPDAAFPAWHGCDVGLNGGVAVGLRNPRVAACEERRLCGARLDGSLLCNLL